MFVALDINKKRIDISDSISDNNYFCPTCGEKLMIRAKESENMRMHFAHIKKCTDDFKYNDMSEWHYNWQLLFPEQNREVVMEKDGEKHRADIFIKNTVIEFQHSPISIDEIKKRNNFYLSLGYNVIWIFDVDGMIKDEFDESIDPFKCSDSLCWKRVQAKFREQMPSKVKVFLNYKTEISNQIFKGKQFDIMILLEKMDKKYIYYYDTLNKFEKKYYYITPNNFLKEFGCCDNPETLSISDIFEKAKKDGWKIDKI